MPPTTPNMGLILPTPTVTPGPEYANENNTAFFGVDSHDHAPGKGLPVPTNGISINADLSFNAFNGTNLRSTRYSNQSTPLSGVTDLGCVYIVNGDLYYNNGIGQQIQITAGAALNAASIGGIGGDYVGSGASVFYTSLTATYTFWQASNTPGNIDVGSVIIRKPTLGSPGVTLKAPSSLSGNYTLTFPVTLPGSGTKFLMVDSTGLVSDVTDVDFSTLVILSNVLKVADQGIDTPQIKDGAVTPAKLSFVPVAFHSQTFNTSGTFNVPAGVTSVYLFGAGGGGGGGGSSGAGGSGAVPDFIQVAVTPLAAITVTIGAGGNGELTAGNAGDNTTFGTIALFGGASGGNPSSGAGNTEAWFATGGRTGSGATGVNGNRSHYAVGGTGFAGGGGGAGYGPGANGGVGATVGDNAAANSSAGGGGGGSGANAGGNGGSGFLIVQWVA